MKNIIRTIQFISKINIYTVFVVEIKQYTAIIPICLGIRAYFHYVFIRKRVHPQNGFSPLISTDFIRCHTFHPTHAIARSPP